MIRIFSIPLVMTLSVSVWAASIYPENPDARLTPGSYCTQAEEHRYPEKIAYCKRHVSTGAKWAVIEKYNEQGFRIENSDRSQFKIDHFIPLGAGGSNKADNLWPQHQTVYEITDPLEGLACEKMAQGRLLQKRAIELIMRAKTHLDEAPSIEATIEAM